MSLTDAMKLFLCAILNDGTTSDDIEENTAILLWQRMAEAFAERFNGGSISVLGELILTSSLGLAAGTTAITVSGATGTNFRYKTNVDLPKYHEDLSDWTSWDGTSEIAVNDGMKICIAEVNESNLAIAAGTVIVNSNV